ncbi:Oidioi.mRNA.OKI2018_I69.PAR.g9152.t1.cds [Oikopleura dioica]|uniref:Oidioi.mRNA.OKI2018_I69.PAR.g9152.t1.cds n=1 Tax=Oikopleura dioica TaxID=34765 RepID=A0ABN7RNF7_OIKDI|nr:Oidioi.mRNA.OKI2018_I69.PAR.g9152.t1.cds [Oikopleura dioica]
MKLAFSFSAFSVSNAFQSVDWNDGDAVADTGNPCGSFIQFDKPEDFGAGGYSLSNATCSITYKMESTIEHIKHAFIGGGAFIESPSTRGLNEFSVFGYPGITSDSFDMVIFWDEAMAKMDKFGNETCGTGNDFALQCTGFETADPLSNDLDGHFMETVNDFRKTAGSVLDFQVIGPKAHELVTVAFLDSDGNRWPCYDFKAVSGIAPYSGCHPSGGANNTQIDCGTKSQFTLLSDDYFVSTLMGFSCTMNDDSFPDLWMSQISRQSIL